MTTLLLQLMDLFTVNSMAFDSMFVFTTVLHTADNAPKGKPKNVTVVDTRYEPTQLADPETTPWMIPYHLYSALMGLIANDGAMFLDSPYPEAFPEQKRLRFSNVDLSFLLFIQSYFEGYLQYHTGITRMHPRSISLQTICTPLIAHLYAVWHDAEGNMILPVHFEQHFNWHTLAFWIMLFLFPA